MPTDITPLPEWILWQVVSLSVLTSCFLLLTEDVSGLGLCRQQWVADAIDVLSHDPDDVLTTLDQLRHLQKQIAGVNHQYWIGELVQSF